jgi:hypothetical protein
MECKDCRVEVCLNNMSHPQKAATGSTLEKNEQIIHDRAECICEICKQMNWRTCENGILDHNCEQLISKFTDHDYHYNPKSEIINDIKRFYIRVAGVKVPETVLRKYVDGILNRMEELGIGSAGAKDELNVYGRLEKQRAEYHMMVLQSIGFNGFVRSKESDIFSKVLDNYIEYMAKRRFKWTIDMDNWLKEYYQRKVNNGKN